MIKDMTQGPEYKFIYHYKQIQCGDKVEVSLNIPTSPPRVQNQEDF